MGRPIGEIMQRMMHDGKGLHMLEAMMSPHGVDRYTELAAPMLTMHDLRAKVTSVHWENGNSVTFVLEPTRQWRGFAAGQYVRIGVVVDGVRHTRCFSPCNSEHRADGQIEITVKSHERTGPSVARELYRRARPGLMVDLEQAAGEFRLPQPRPRNIVLIAGGSGITPALSMLRTLDDERRAGTWNGRVALLYYTRGPEDLVHAGALRRLGRQAGPGRPVRSREAGKIGEAGEPGKKGECSDTAVGLIFTGGSAEPGGTVVPSDAAVSAETAAQPEYATLPDGAPRGHFRPAHIDAVAPWFRESGDAQTYLCGPPRMMDAVRAAFGDMGRAEHLHTEEFTVASLGLPDGAEGDAAGGEASGAVAYTASGVTADNDGRVLLEQAEAAGLTPDYGCRMGICFTCTSVRRSGCTRNVLTGETSAEPDQPIQLCVNVPVGDVDVEI